MDLFPDRQHVRLRNVGLGTYYLHADEDGADVSVSQSRDSLNVAWTVHMEDNLNAGLEGGEHFYVRLHSAAYGRYLATTTTRAPSGHIGFRTEQRDYDRSPMAPILWIGTVLEGGVLLADLRGRYLRANGKFFRWNNRVTVEKRDFTNANSTMMRWIVEPIPLREHAPPLPLPRQTSVPFFRRASPRTPRVVSWQIRYVRADPQGRCPEHGWLTRYFDASANGRSVYRLRDVLGYAGIVEAYGQRRNFAICVRAGHYGRLTPLVVDLPRYGNGQVLEMIVFMSGTPGYAALQYPNMEAA